MSREMVKCTQAKSVSMPFRSSISEIIPLASMALFRLTVLAEQSLNLD